MKNAETIARLQTLFETIRDERATAANTATRIGNAFISLLSLAAENDVDIESLPFIRNDRAGTAREIVDFIKGLKIGGRKADFTITATDGAEAETHDPTETLTTRSYTDAAFLSKRADDATPYTLTAGKLQTPDAEAATVHSPGFAQGETDGSGFAMFTDAQGRAHVETDILTVRLKALFQELEIKRLTHAGGSIVLSMASATITEVTDAWGNANYKQVWWPAEDGNGTTTTNDFRELDLVRCQEFGTARQGANGTVENREWWAAVSQVGTELHGGTLMHYLILDFAEPTAYNGSTDRPQAGDDIVLLGSAQNADRSRAIILSTADTGAPSIKGYQGIGAPGTSTAGLTTEAARAKRFTLAGRDVFTISPQGCIFRSDFFTISGNQFSRYMGEWDSATIYNEGDIVTYQGRGYISYDMGNCGHTPGTDYMWKTLAQDGKDGQPGAPGTDGKDGQPGAPGTDGKDGKPYTLIVKEEKAYIGKDANGNLTPSKIDFALQYEITKAPETDGSAATNITDLTAEGLTLTATISRATQNAAITFSRSGYAFYCNDTARETGVQFPYNIIVTLSKGAAVIESRAVLIGVDSGTITKINGDLVTQNARITEVSGDLADAVVDLDGKITTERNERTTAIQSYSNEFRAGLNSLTQTQTGDRATLNSKIEQTARQITMEVTQESWGNLAAADTHFAGERSGNAIYTAIFPATPSTTVYTLPPAKGAKRAAYFDITAQADIFIYDFAAGDTRRQAATSCMGFEKLAEDGNFTFYVWVRTSRPAQVQTCWRWQGWGPTTDVPANTWTLCPWTFVMGQGGLSYGGSTIEEYFFTRITPKQSGTTTVYICGFSLVRGTSDWDGEIRDFINLDSRLARTGIDITAGKIRLDAANTEISGNMKLRGLVYDETMQVLQYRYTTEAVETAPTPGSVRNLYGRVVVDLDKVKNVSVPPLYQVILPQAQDVVLPGMKDWETGAALSQPVTMPGCFEHGANITITASPAVSDLPPFEWGREKAESDVISGEDYTDYYAGSFAKVFPDARCFSGQHLVDFPSFMQWGEKDTAYFMCGGFYSRLLLLGPGSSVQLRYNLLRHLDAEENLVGTSCYWNVLNWGDFTTANLYVRWQENGAPHAYFSAENWPIGLTAPTHDYTYSGANPVLARWRVLAPKGLVGGNELIYGDTIYNVWNNSVGDAP